jgi:uncharacterized membrane protein
MRNLSKLGLIGMTAIALTFFNPLKLDWQTGLSRQNWVQGDRAEAKSSAGGRSRGGSFSGGSSANRSSDSRSSGGSSSGGSSSGARSSGSSSSDRSRRSDPGYSYSRPVYGYSSGYSSSYSSGSTSSSGDGVWLALILVGGIIAAIAYLIWKVKSSGGTDEKGNDIVTVTQLQVALLAQERDIQNRLSELTLNADMETPEGRGEMLKESVLALLRSPENWSHVHSQSQIVKDREAAGQVFEQISMTERSKLEAESLVNIGGKVRHQALKISEDSDPGSYIIVTLLVGTEHDKPLFDKVQTSEGLKTALQNLGAVSIADLLILELLWNPQDSKESLTYDEMLVAYPELRAIG